MLISRQAKLALFIFFILIAIFWFFGDILLPFLIGAAIAYLLNPVADRLENFGINRLISVIVIFLFFILGLVLFCLLMLPLIFNQFVALVEHAPNILRSLVVTLSDKFQHLIDIQYIQAQIEVIRLKLQSNAFNLTKGFYHLVVDTVNSLLIFIISPIVSIYLLIDWKKIISKLKGLIPLQKQEKVQKIFIEIDSTLSQFVRGQILVCSLLALFYAICLSILGLNYGIVIGLIAGIISFIPYIGAVLGGILALVLAFYQFWPDPTWIVGVLIVFIIGQLLEGNYLTPKIIGSSIGLHPVWLLFSLTFFGSVFGFFGLLIAVPLAAAIGVIVRFGLTEYQNSKFFNGNLKE